MWSRSAITLSTGHCDRAERSATLASINPFPRTSCSTVWRNAAPGNGTWSRVHWPIAW